MVEVVQIQQKHVKMKNVGGKKKQKHKAPYMAEVEQNIKTVHLQVYRCGLF